MPLQGKLSIGLLSEDNPYKSYFVYKPLFIRQGDAYEAFADPEKSYPEDGAIRIVPDKNEMNTFKARMRKIGALCAMDLRRFVIENNKIRANKNYSREMGERNQYIVYSDVLTPLSPAEFAEVIDAPEGDENDAEIAVAMRLLTNSVALRRGEALVGPYLTTVAESGETTLTPAQERWEFNESEMSDQGRLMKVVLDDGSTRLILGALCGEEEPAPPAQPEPLHRPIEPERESAKPWIARDESIAPPPNRGFPNTRDQFMAAQSGLNPRRGRSLSEVVDDQWRKSRIDQLGHPVPSSAAGRPMTSPVERAMDAVLDAWRLREARGGLLDRLVNVLEIREALKGYFALDGKSGEAAAFEAALNEFEASRLKLAMEVDELRAGRDALYEKVMEEVRARNASEINQLERQKAAVQSEVARFEGEIAALEHRAASANKALHELFGERFEELISRKIFSDRAVARLQEEIASHDVRERPVAGDVGAEALIERTDAYLKRAGFHLPREEVVNLLILIAIGDAVVLSGAPGSGHASLPDALAAALPGAGITKIMDINGAAADDACVAGIVDRKGGESAFAVAHDAPEGKTLSQRLLCGAYFVRVAPPSPKHPWGDFSPPPAAGDDVPRTVILEAFAPGEVPAQISVKLLEMRAALQTAGYLMGREMLNGLYRYCAIGSAYLGLASVEVLDWALAQRALPAIMASMEPRVLRALPSVFVGMPRCRALMHERLPVF